MLAVMDPYAICFPNWSTGKHSLRNLVNSKIDRSDWHLKNILENNATLHWRYDTNLVKTCLDWTGRKLSPIFSILEPCPKLVLSDHSATNLAWNTQLAYDFLLHRRKLMMSIYHELRALYNFHSRLRLLNTQYGVVLGTQGKPFRIQYNLSWLLMHYGKH